MAVIPRRSICRTNSDLGVFNGHGALLRYAYTGVMGGLIFSEVLGGPLLAFARRICRHDLVGRLGRTEASMFTARHVV